VAGSVATMNGRVTIGMLAGMAVLAVSAVHAEESEEPTAFALIELGNDYVGIESKGKVVQIRSERSVGDVVPQIWYIVYYDPDARFRATEVKFAGRRKLDVKRPTRLFERVAGATSAISEDRLNIDSDEAIAIALKEPLLERLTIKATELRLEKAGGKGRGDETLPIWRVRLWAERLNRPGREVDIGEVIVSAEDGKVLEADLRIQRVG
jgi:hypothetical protein